MGSHSLGERSNMSGLSINDRAVLGMQSLFHQLSQQVNSQVPQEVKPLPKKSKSKTKRMNLDAQLVSTSIKNAVHVAALFLSYYTWALGLTV